MNGKQQAKAITFLRRVVVYMEDMKADNQPNGCKLRDEIAEFVKRIEEQEEETETSKK